MTRSIIPLAVALTLVLACSEGESPEFDGEVEGEVHLLGDLAEPPTSGVVQLYATLAAVDQRTPIREAALTGGPANWDFHLDEVPPGTYYLGACFAFGCGTHSDIEGHPAPVEVIADQTTRAVMAF